MPTVFSVPLPVQVPTWTFSGAEILDAGSRLSGSLRGVMAGLRSGCRQRATALLQAVLRYCFPSRRFFTILVARLSPESIGGYLYSLWEALREFIEVLPFHLRQLSGRMTRVLAFFCFPHLPDDDEDDDTDGRGDR